MRYLAQVQKKGFLGKAALQLLASEKSDGLWARITNQEPLVSAEAMVMGEGMLVMVDVTDNRDIVSIQDATPWVLTLVDAYLTTGITPDFLNQERDRAEQWRQSLTIQSQELSRRALEVEARRDQIQALEENLKKEKAALEQQKKQLSNSQKTLDEDAEEGDEGDG